MLTVKRHLQTTSMCIALSLSGHVAGAGFSTGSNYGPPSSTQMPQLRTPPSHQPVNVKPQSPPLARPVLPPMAKPFGMPGVVGLVKDKWEGTDYLGFLSDKIGIDIEILKTNEVPAITDSSVIHQRAAEIFIKNDLIPNAEVTEGPPLPFLHLLLIVYPVDQDHFVILGNSRLFEKIKVERKDFVPSGYWQGITWEHQDVSLATTAQLDEKIKQLADKLVTSFVDRYRQYNLAPSVVPPVN